MQQNEQGFFEEKQALVDFNYLPTFYHSSLNNTIQKQKDKKDMVRLLMSSYINQQLRQTWVTSILNNSNINLVFNNFKKDLVKVKEKNVSFDSAFQCGNLQLVDKIKGNYYELYMRPDTNTQAHFQWFYFKVIVCKCLSKTFNFKIKNFVKSKMLYNQGLKPFYRSLKPGSDEQYKQLSGQVKYQEQVGINQGFFSLEFSYQFDDNQEEIEFCSQPPYRLDDLKKLIKELKNGKKMTLCKSLLGIPIPYIIYQSKRQCKAVVIAIGRQHPGQTVGSWMMEGFLKRLDNNDLNNQITWVIIPMMNIDGVILGNNRTSAMGHDLNRNWNFQQTQPGFMLKKSKLFQQLNATMQLVKDLKRKYRSKIKMFLDFHGHSSQQNVFTYGPPYQFGAENYYVSRLFPQLIAGNNKNFNIEQCSYMITPDKKKSARSVFFTGFGIPFTYTIQSSFGIYRGKPVGTKQFQEVGKDIAVSAHQFLYRAIIDKKQSREFEMILKFLKQKYVKTQKEVKQFDSDSQESNQSPLQKQFQKNISDLILKDCSSKQRRTFKTQHKRVNFKLTGKQHSLFKLEESLVKQEMPVVEKSELPKQGHKMSKLRVLTECSTIDYRQKLPQIRKVRQRNSQRYGQELKSLSTQIFQKKINFGKTNRVGKKILIINTYGL